MAGCGSVSAPRRDAAADGHADQASPVDVVTPVDMGVKNDAGDGGADGGPSGTVLLQGGIASLGGVAVSGAVRIYDDGLETGARVCAGNICVTGAITP